MRVFTILTILTFFLAIANLNLAILTFFLRITWYKLAYVWYSQNCEIFWVYILRFRFFTHNSDFVSFKVRFWWGKRLNCEFMSHNSDLFSKNCGSNLKMCNFSNLFFSELSVYISLFWRYNSQLHVCISQFWEKSKFAIQLLFLFYFISGVNGLP